MAAPESKRGFKEVSVVEDGGGFALRLDDRAMKTPAGSAIVLPSRKLADALATEWRAAGPLPKAGALPLTQMAATALDRIGKYRADIETQLVSYAETELLCHWAEHPPELVARQHHTWQPLLDWLAQRHAAKLTTTAGIRVQPQDTASLDAVRATLAGLDLWRLAALSVAVAVSGSLVIGLALVDARLDAAAAFEAAELDATFQIEKWGEDAEATARRAGVRAELDLVERFLGLLAG